MKRVKIYALIFTYLLTLTGCGKIEESLETSLQDDFSYDNASPVDVSHGSDNTGSSAESAYAAYSSLLSGDISLFDDEQINTWGLADWSAFLQSDSLTYEYAYLDLDGDGTDELLFQMENNPGGHNAVFHYADGKLVCWENDMVEAASSQYPLSDGTMVSQYDFNGNRSYTIFRYLPDGGHEVLFRLFMRESPIEEGSDDALPYYEINGTQVDQIVFEEQLKTFITNRILPRSVWITL